MKKLVVSALVSLIFLPSPISIAPADARVSVNVNVDVGRGRINCRQGQRIVERRGFRNVRPRDCGGSIFVYSGRRGGDNFWIDVRRRDGRIVSTRRRR